MYKALFVVVLKQVKNWPKLLNDSIECDKKDDLVKYLIGSMNFKEILKLHPKKQQQNKLIIIKWQKNNRNRIVV